MESKRRNAIRVFLIWLVVMYGNIRSYLKLISPSIKPKLDFSLKNISPVAVSLVKIQRSDSFQVQLTRILPAGISMVSVPPNLRALALSVQDVRNAIAVIAMTKIFFMVLCDRIYGRVSYKVQI